jgi:hypothetical protein
MGSVVYTATESLLPNRLAGQTVAFEIGFQDARRSRSVEKTVQRSEGGAMEVLKHRAEVTWDITFEPVNGTTLDQLREFLDSTEAGESFLMDPYGTASTPTQVKRVDDGYSEEPFIRNGSASTDYFFASIRVVEV